MNEPFWLSIEAVIAIRGELIAEHGGQDGMRDAGLLQSTLDRPRNRWHYGERDVPVLAAAYRYALANIHAFVDGNKCVALASIFAFLAINGVAFAPSAGEPTAALEGVADGSLGEEQLAGWLRLTSPV